MTEFTREKALCVLTKLEATTTNSHGFIGVVPLNHSFRVRLLYPAGEVSPLFIQQKWRQALRLSTDEFDALADCTLSGPDALSLTCSRCGLDPAA